jgi:hypothetical protein
VLKVVLPPLAAAYAAFVVMVVVARRRPVPRRHGRERSFGPSGRASVVGTVVGGYVAFLIIVLVFHVWIAGEGDVLWSAAWGGAFLSSVALAIWAGLSLIGLGIARRR